MRFKKSYGLLPVLLLTPLVLAGVVQSIGPPTIYINVSSYGITVYGNNWTPYTDVAIYYDVEDAAHMVAVVEANYGGYFQTRIPTDYIPTVGTHTVIAVQGADKATAVNNVGTTAPPDDRLLNPILSIKDKLDDVDLEVKAIEAKLDAGGSFYNFVDTWFGSINGTIYACTEALEDKLDAVNAEQMLYSGRKRAAIHNLGDNIAVRVETNKTAKYTVTYFAYWSNVSDTVDLHIRDNIGAGNWARNVKAMHSDGTSGAYSETLTVTMAAWGVSIEAYVEYDYVLVDWWITVEGSPDTSVTVTTY